jgi:hypothetical protein
MVVESVQAYYAPYEPYIDGIPIGHWENPEFYVRGFVYKNGFNPCPGIVRMHVYLRVHDKGQFEGATLQVMRAPSGVEPSTLLVYATHGLGQT